MSAFDQILQGFRERNEQSTPAVAGLETARQSGGILRQRANAVRALERKQSDAGYRSALAQLPEPVRRALEARDQKRTDAGQMPVPVDQAIKAGAAAATREAVTPTEPNTSLVDIPTNAVRDLGQIVKSLPHLPRALADEVRDIADGFEDDRREAREAGRSGIAEVLSLPGVRLVPGAYVASNIAAGDTDELVEHPLLNLLDVLPVASKAAKGLPAVKAAETAAEVTRSTGQYVKPVRPLKVAALQRLDDAGDLVPSRLGELSRKLWETRPLAIISDNFGEKSRATMRQLGIEEQNMQARGSRPDADDAIGRVYADWAPLMSDDALLAERYPGLTRAREQEISAIAARSPSDRSALSATEQKYLADADAVREQMAEHIASTTGDLMKVDGEWFPRADGRRLEAAALRASKKVAAVTGTRQMVRKRVGGQWVERLDTGVMDDLDALAVTDSRWLEIRESIDGGDIPAAARRVNQLKNYGAQGVGGVTDQKVVAIRRALNEAHQALRTSDALRARINPSRFDELINERSGEAYLKLLEERSVVSNVDEARRLLDQGTLDQIPGFDRGEWEKVRRAQQQTWQKLRDAGEDPMFVGRVTAERAQTIGQARLDGTMPSLQTARRRVSDMSPSVNSVAVSVSNQAWDIIRRESADAAINMIRTEFGVPESELLRQFTPIAEQLAASNPRYDVVSARNTLMRRQYRPLDAGSLSTSGVPAGGLGGERVWVPRQVANTLKQVQSNGLSQMRALNDPITRTWRISLLALSPRWHLYNIVGGAGMMSAEVGPQAFRQMKAARDIVKAASEGAELPRAVEREVHRAVGQVGREEAMLALRQGATARRWFDQSRAAKAGRGLIQKSFDWNSYVDDMYRVMTYLEGEQLALSKYKRAGHSDDAAKALAAEEAVVLSRKVLQDVAALTPFERSVLRPIFPFYSWLSHLMRFAFNYPADHPWRAALVAGGSRIVMEDFGDGASLDMLDLISWGEPDEEGKRSAVRVGGMNPFNDTAKLFTLAGWLGNTNPLFATAAQALGFDAQQGGIDLYPSMSYSAETGGMVVDTGNPIKNLTLNSLPHLGALVRFMGQDPEYQKLRMSDPETADRVLWGGVGLPTAYRRYSAENDYIGAELKRQEAADDTESQALKAGDLDALIPIYGEEKVAAIKRARESGLLDEYLAYNRDPADGRTTTEDRP